MIKKLLFALVLATFFGVSAMAQAPTKDLFIGTTDNLRYDWSREDGKPVVPATDGFVWNSNFRSDFSNAKDSTGAVTYGNPYEGADHYEFDYDFTGWWCSGGWNFGAYIESPVGSGNWRPPYIDFFSKYTHLKLYTKGFSAQNPHNVLKFQLNGGPSVVVADSSNSDFGNGSNGYVEKIISLKSFMGTALPNLDTINKMGYSIADGDNTWWQTSGASSGFFFMDAMQLVSWIKLDAGATTVMNKDTFDFGSTAQGSSSATTTFTITNTGDSSLTLSGGPMIDISGANAADFTVVQSGVTSPLAPSGTTTFTVTFNPSTVGTETATLSIANNFSPNGSLLLNLTGTGTSVTGLSNSKGTDSYTAYPSPFSDETVIKVNSTVSAPMSIKVMDTKGTVVSTSENHFTNENITIGKGLERGIYFVQTTYQDRIQVIKIVKM